MGEGVGEGSRRVELKTGRERKEGDGGSFFFGLAARARKWIKRIGLKQNSRRAEKIMVRVPEAQEEIDAVVDHVARGLEEVLETENRNKGPEMEKVSAVFQKVYFGDAFAAPRGKATMLLKCVV